MESINFYLQNDVLLCIDNNLIRYKPIKVSECIGKDYYDNVVHLLWDLDEIPEDFKFPQSFSRITFAYLFNSNVNGLLPPFHGTTSDRTVCHHRRPS